MLNKEYYLVGKISLGKNNKHEIITPDIEEKNEKDSIHSARISPYYPLTAGIKQKFLRSKIKWVIDKLDYLSDIDEILPDYIISKYNLFGLKTAIKNIHFPETESALTYSKKRLSFDEMLLIQLRQMRLKGEIEKLKTINIKSTIINKAITEFFHNIPFSLTTDQENAINEILTDIGSGKPMYRLLQGDVGSGKTVVAAAAAAVVAHSGYDVAIMAPTTILANQIKQVIQNFIPTIEIRLLTGNSPQNRINTLSRTDHDNNNSIGRGKIHIGTHALIYQKDTEYSNLGLVIIDEQHRFGVEQRKKLYSLNSSICPHYLMMTATPIPRTLLLALVGDMQTSVIKTKPAGRRSVLTYLVPREKKPDSYKWFNSKLKSGEQIFWICPLIENNEDSTLKSIKQTEQILKKVLNARIAILHGKLTEYQKNQLLSDFKNNVINVLISTTVVEVGVDIPNANIIVIESAEQFGLAQLHQLRGRVGRSPAQAYCFLFSDKTSDNPNIYNRLTYFSKEHDGLKIAEYDLHQRGPGEVYGIKQSGIPALKLANILDLTLIKETRKAAQTILRNGDNISF